MVNGSYRVVAGLIGDIDKLNDLLVDWVEKAFPIGTEVHWQHGNHTRSGVVDLHPNWSARAGELRVKLRTGSTKWISVMQIGELAADLERQEKT